MTVTIFNHQPVVNEVWRRQFEKSWDWPICPHPARFASIRPKRVEQPYSPILLTPRHLRTKPHQPLSPSIRDYKSDSRNTSSFHLRLRAPLVAMYLSKLTVAHRRPSADPSQCISSTPRANASTLRTKRVPRASLQSQRTLRASHQMINSVTSVSLSSNAMGCFPHSRRRRGLMLACKGTVRRERNSA